MKEYYPLTAAQKLHYNWMKTYKTQQVSGVSVVAAGPVGFRAFKEMYPAGV